MAEQVEIKIEKFHSMWGIYFGLSLMIIGLSLSLLTENIEKFFLSLLGFFLFGAFIVADKKMKKNPMVLKVTKEGLHLPLNRAQTFIPWERFVKIEHIARHGAFSGIPVELAQLAISYRADKDRNKISRCILPYTTGKGKPLNFTKDEIIDMVRKASKNA